MERRPGWPFRVEKYYTTALLCWCLRILVFLLPVLDVHGSQAPRTELEAVTIHDFLFGRPVDAPPYFVSGNFTVQILQARHPSPDVVGVRYRYLSTLVTLFYGDTQFGQAAEVPIRFSQGYKSTGVASADVVFRRQPLDDSVAWLLHSDLESDMYHHTGVPFRITVDAYVETVKSLKWQNPATWFNLTCWVKLTIVPFTYSETGNMLSKSCDWDSPALQMSAAKHYL